MVLAMRDEVPAQEMVFSALRSAATVGRVTLMPFWSTKAMRREMARPPKTTRSWLLGRMLVWSWRAFSAACCRFIV